MQKKHLALFSLKKYLFYIIPEKYSWIQKILDKFLEKIYADENGIKLSFKFI